MLADRYRVDELVARGGMSEVYRGWDVRLDRRVAVKVLAGWLAADGAAVRRMEREARAVARLQHPNVVAVYDHGEDADGTPFLVMEWIEGRSLKDVVADGPLSEQEARRITLQLLAALEHAHEHGIVHRDIKPQNVLIAPDGTAKLTDFGIARSIDATAGLTMAGQIIGTAAYLSPEQANGQPVTSASDVYSVGAVLFELVTGRPPFAADTAMATALMHVEDPVPDVRALRRDASPAIAAVVVAGDGQAAGRPLPERRGDGGRPADDARRDAGDAGAARTADASRRAGAGCAARLARRAGRRRCMGARAARATTRPRPRRRRRPAAKPTLTTSPVIGLQYVTAARRLKAAGLTPGPRDRRLRRQREGLRHLGLTTGRCREGVDGHADRVERPRAAASPAGGQGARARHHQHKHHGQNGDRATRATRRRPPWGSRSSDSVTLTGPVNSGLARPHLEADADRCPSTPARCRSAPTPRPSSPSRYSLEYTPFFTRDVQVARPSPPSAG